MLRGIETTVEVLLVIAITVPLFLVWAVVMLDLVRRKDLSVVRKFVWAAIVVFTVYIGSLAYFVFRPVPPPAGKREHDREDRSSRIVESIEQLHNQHEAGEITDDDYLSTKRELLGLTPL